MTLKIVEVQFALLATAQVSGIKLTDAGKQEESRASNDTSKLSESPTGSPGSEHMQCESLIKCHN